MPCRADWKMFNRRGSALILQPIGRNAIAVTMQPRLRMHSGHSATERQGQKKETCAGHTWSKLEVRVHNRASRGALSWSDRPGCVPGARHAGA